MLTENLQRAPLISERKWCSLKDIPGGQNFYLGLNTHMRVALASIITILNLSDFFAPVLCSKVLRPFFARGLLSGEETVVGKSRFYLPESPSPSIAVATFSASSG